MNAVDFDNSEIRKKLFIQIKPYFRDKLGKYTHQRITESWHFHGLAFVKDEMTYLFGFNLGFFKAESAATTEYTHTGMNVLIRKEGNNEMLRLKFCDFYQHNLQHWVTGEQKDFSSFRGKGLELPRYKRFDEFKDENEIIEFWRTGIDGIFELYPKIIENPGGIFTGIVRAAPPWHDTLIHLCNERLDYLKKRRK